jgi:hypothetical protein
MIYADPNTGNVREDLQAPLAPHTQFFATPAEYHAWQVANFPPPPEVPVTYTRADYKAALDAMLLSECKRDGYDFDGIQTLAVYLFDPSNEFYPRAQWLARLNVFTWTTSNELSKQPPAGDPPTPEQFAGYILGLFEASNPRPV